MYKLLLFTLFSFTFFNLSGQIGYDQNAASINNSTYTGANNLVTEPTKGGDINTKFFPGDSYSGTIEDDGVSADFTVTHLTQQSGYNQPTENVIFSSPGYGIGINARQGTNDNGGDIMAYKITLNTVPSTHKAVIRLRQNLFGQNSEYSTYKVSWVGGETANAVFYDAPANSASVDAPGSYSFKSSANNYTTGYYRFGAHEAFNGNPAFDYNNRQIAGTTNTGEIASGGTFDVYAIFNNRAEWYVEFPVGVTEVTVIKTAATDGVAGTMPSSDPSNGIDVAFPSYGRFMTTASAGETSNEFFAFKVDLIPNSILPVDFGDVSAHASDDGVDVSWNTYSEINNSHFEVERSSDGKNFTTIGQVEGQGTSSTKTEYTFLDKNSDMYGTLYYRIKQVDYDGKFAYSSIQVVKYDGSKEFTIFPNPAPAGSLAITGIIVKSVVVRDLTGRIVHKGTSNQLDFSDLKKGMYFATINKYHTKLVTIL